MSGSWLDALTKVLGVTSNSLSEIEAKLPELAAKYPDLKDRAAAVEQFLATQIAPELDPATVANTLKGIATDIVSGHSGVDPKAWGAGV